MNFDYGNMYDILHQGISVDQHWCAQMFLLMENEGYAGIPYGPELLSRFYLQFGREYELVLLFQPPSNEMHKSNTVTPNKSIRDNHDKHNKRMLTISSGRGTSDNGVFTPNGDIRRNHQKINQHNNIQQSRASSTMSGGVNKKNDKHFNNHPWCMTTLKGHINELYDIGYSSDGKYLASCAEASSSSAVRTISLQQQQQSLQHQLAHNNFINNCRRRRISCIADDGDLSDDTNTSINGHSSSGSSSSSSSSRNDSSNEASPKPVRFRSPDNGDIDLLNKSSESIRTKSRRRHRKNHRISNVSTSSRGIINEKENEKQELYRKYGSFLPAASMSSELDRTRALAPPLKEHIKLNMAEWKLVKFLKENYLLKETNFCEYGFPFKHQDSFVYIYLTDFCFRADQPRPFDVNAREFKPSSAITTMLTTAAATVIINEKDDLATNDIISTDSGQSSGTSSPPTSTSQSGDGDSDICGSGEDNRKIIRIDNENKTAAAAAASATTTHNILNDNLSCVRCSSSFAITKSGEYKSKDHCFFHHGRQEHVFNNDIFSKVYTCCGKTTKSKGCTQKTQHVWNGLNTGFNGPLIDFVEAKQPEFLAEDGNYGVFAIDCEMCYTIYGLELTKITIIKSDGSLFYEKYVKPNTPIIDYNTRYSGITPKLLSTRSVVTLADVQTDILKFINSETILIGHAIHNDLRALKLLHKNIIDTSILFPHKSGLPYRMSLKQIVKLNLRREIQTGTDGHCSFEDSRACLEALLWKVRRNYQRNGDVDMMMIRQPLHDNATTTNCINN